MRHEVATLVFTPDRLAVVKGGPAVRRAYFDRTLARLFPARSGLSIEYAAAVAQRNAALRRMVAGFSTRDALDPWTARVAELGAALVEARTEVVALLAPVFAQSAGELGLTAARLEYEGEPPTTEALESATARDHEAEGPLQRVGFGRPGNMTSVGDEEDEREHREAHQTHWLLLSAAVGAGNAGDAEPELGAKTP